MLNRQPLPTVARVRLQAPPPPQRRGAASEKLIKVVLIIKDLRGSAVAQIQDIQHFLPNFVVTVKTHKATQNNFFNITPPLKGIEMIKPIRNLAVILTILATALPLKSFAQQETYPNRPINLIVPFPAGNINDVHARILAKAMSTELGQQVIVDNKAGAAGIIGTQFVSTAKPDGYTILWGSSGPLATHPFVYKKLPYTQQSLSPVNGIGAAPLMMVTNSSKPYKTLVEFIEYARKNPGKATFGSSGIGTGGHLAGELFQLTTGVQMLHIPYKEASSLNADLHGGRLDVVFDFIPVVASQIKSAKLVGLGITSENRNKNFSEIPTFKESGYNITITSWNSIMVPAQTSPAIIKRISDAAKAAAKSPESLRFERDFDTISISHMGPEMLRQFIVSESEVFRNIVAKTGLSIDN